MAGDSQSLSYSSFLSKSVFSFKKEIERLDRDRDCEQDGDRGSIILIRIHTRADSPRQAGFPLYEYPPNGINILRKFTKSDLNAQRLKHRCYL